MIKANAPVRWRLVILAGLATLFPVFVSPAQTAVSPPGRAQIRFLDSATGYAVQPQSVTAHAHVAGAIDKSIATGQLNKAGDAGLTLESGLQTITAAAENYQPMSGDFDISDKNPCTIRFLLDPIQLPRELEPGDVMARHRPDSTLIQGFVVDDETGEPLPGVLINSVPNGAAAIADDRGYFVLYLPAQTDAEAQTSPVSLTFAKSGYDSEEHQYLELWPDSDWTYRIRLFRGDGKRIVDERALRRRATPDLAAATESPAKNAVTPSGATVSSNQVSSLTIGPDSTAITNSTVRVPRNIRVLRQDGTNIDYISLDTYCKHVLPSEWIAGWGSPTSYPGGSNCLSAGAVAVRCYAIAKINAASGTSTYDICATTSCQVYNPATSSSYTDTAVDYTANYVVISSAGAISSTEYSAENNSLANSCGDGFTEPSTTGPVCIFDPVCTGETRNGHGRGMCQWGSAKWASGRKFTGNSTGNSTLNGYPKRDWIWIVQHYYPTLTLVKGAALIIGDDVKAVGVVNVNMCADGGITNGVNCPLLTGVSSGTTGVIVDGPLTVLADGKGFTWYKIQWNDASSTLGWAKENYLERVFSLPGTPTTLTAAAAGTNQINLNWVNNSPGVEAGFKIERAMASGGPWLEITNVPAGTNAYADKNLFGGSSWYYRVRAYNAAGNSAYSGTASATTSNAPPVLAAIGNRTLVEGATLTITNSVTASDYVQLITDFEPFMTETSNGIILFRDPTNSTSTSGFLAASPDLAVITDVFSSSGNSSARALRINCSFGAVANPWLRLTTAGATTFPNPVIDFTKKLRFSIYADKAVKVAVGCRETTTAAGTAIGANGGTSGGIEWAGVTNLAGTAPIPTRTVPAGAWTTLTFDFPNEPVVNFSGGNGILSTASGLGVLEHLAIVPAGGTGAYNLYFDNFAVVAPRTFTYSLGAGAPTNAVINATTGVFSWTPTEGQGPSSNNIAIIVADNGSPAGSATNVFTVIVVETNTPPVLSPIGNFTVHAGSTVTFTNSATDADLPANSLTYSLDPGAPAAATVNPVTGVFNWATDDQSNPTNNITVRVTDNGTPPLSDAKTFTVAVLPRPRIQGVSISGGGLMMTWSAISGTTYRVQYKNNLDDSSWTNLVPDVQAQGDTASFTESATSARRFYRVLVVD